MRQWLPARKRTPICKPTTRPYPASNWRLSHSGAGATLSSDTSTSQPRPVVPEGWRRQVFDVIHGLSHSSIHTSRRLIASKFVWYGLKKTGRGLGRSLHPMSNVQGSAAHQSLLQSFQMPGHHFDHFHIDLVGPLPASEGFTYLLTMVNRFTR